MKFHLLTWKQSITLFLLSIPFVLAGCNGPQNPLSGFSPSSAPTPVDQGHLIYTLSDKSIHAIHSSNGTIAWHQDTSGTYQEALVTKNTVYVIGDKLYTFNAASGKPGWSEPIGSQSMVSNFSNIAVDDSNVYIVADGVALAFNAKNGNIQWRTTLQQPSNAGMPDGGLETIYPVIIVQNGILYTNNNDGSFVAALRTSDGTQLWGIRIPDDIGSDTLGLGLYYQPVDNLFLHNGVLYAMTSSDIAALNIQSGTISWQKIVGRIDSMAMFNNAIDINTYQSVVGSPPSGSYQVQLSNGGSSTLNLPSGSVDFEHGYMNGTVYMIGGPTNGDIMAVQLSNDSTMWDTPSTGKMDFLSVVDGNVYAVRDDGMIMLLNGKTGKTIWSQPMPQGEGENIQVDGDEIYSMSDGQITAIDVHTGHTLWTATTDGNKTSLTGSSAGPLVLMSSN